MSVSGIRMMRRAPRRRTALIVAWLVSPGMTMPAAFALPQAASLHPNAAAQSPGLLRDVTKTILQEEYLPAGPDTLFPAEAFDETRPPKIRAINGDDAKQDPRFFSLWVWYHTYLQRFAKQRGITIEQAKARAPWRLVWLARGSHDPANDFTDWKHQLAEQAQATFRFGKEATATLLSVIDGVWRSASDPSEIAGLRVEPGSSRGPATREEGDPGSVLPPAKSTPEKGTGSDETQPSDEDPTAPDHAARLEGAITELLKAIEARREVGQILSDRAERELTTLIQWYEDIHRANPPAERWVNVQERAAEIAQWFREAPAEFYQGHQIALGSALANWESPLAAGTGRREAAPFSDTRRYREGSQTLWQEWQSLLSTEPNLEKEQKERALLDQLLAEFLSEPRSIDSRLTFFAKKWWSIWEMLNDDEQATLNSLLAEQSPVLVDHPFVRDALAARFAELSSSSQVTSLLALHLRAWHNMDRKEAVTMAAALVAAAAPPAAAPAELADVGVDRESSLREMIAGSSLAGFIVIQSDGTVAPRDPQQSLYLAKEGNRNLDKLELLDGVSADSFVLPGDHLLVMLLRIV